MNKDGTIVRCFMDGIDWEHHLGSDMTGPRLYPSEEAVRLHEPCVTTGGCGIVEVEVRFVRWAEEQNLNLRFEDAAAEVCRQITNKAAVVARNKKAARTRAKMKAARARHTRRWDEAGKAK